MFKSVAQFFRYREVRLAWLVAIAADAIQIILLPLFAVGALAPADPLIDAAAALILSQLLGWHWAFLPTLFAELVPGLDLFPTWTTAVFYVTVRHSRSEQPEVRETRDARVVTGRFLNS